MDPNEGNVGETITEVSEAVSFDVVNDPVVDGKYVLAKVRGPAFFPGQVSGNKVFYPTELWDKVLADPSVNERLQSRTMFGTIGHDIEDINDAVIRKGDLSHVVTNLFVDENGVGMAEYLVVNTPAGEILNTLLRAGSKLRVSTKAKGALSAPDQNGIKTLRSYYLKRVDFVLTPGFENALPEVAESLSRLKNTPDNSIEENKMEGTEFITHLKAENAELKSKVDESLTTIGKLQSKIDQQAAELASATEVSESLTTATAELEAYRALGTPAQIDEALTRGTQTIEELRSSLSTSVEESAADLNDLVAVEEELEKYRALGSVEDISESIKSLDQLIDQKEKEVSESLAKKYKRSPAMIELMAKSLGGLDKVDEALAEEAAALGIAIDEAGSDNGDGTGDPKDPTDPADAGNGVQDNAGAAAAAPGTVDESAQGPAATSRKRLERASSLMSTQRVRTNMISTKVDESKATAPENTSRASRLMSRR